MSVDLVIILEELWPDNSSTENTKLMMLPIHMNVTIAMINNKLHMIQLTDVCKIRASSLREFTCIKVSVYPK